MVARSAKQPKVIFRKPVFWFIIALFVLITIPHYQESLSQPAFLVHLLTDIGLTRHAFERILYLVPIFLAGFGFGWKGSLFTSLAALALMLPRDFFISQYRTDALFETGAVFVLSIMLTMAFGVFHKEKVQRAQLEDMHKKLRNSEERLHYYLGQATRAQEEERKRIALELHDETIQDLVVLSRRLDVLASKGKELTPENSLLLKDLRRQTKSIIQSLRNLSQHLRPSTLDRLGLVPALGHLAFEVTEYSGIITKVNVLGTERRLPEEEELMLFRIAQEALRNVWRHSQAEKAEIILEFSEQKVKVAIRDNGKGFYLSGMLDDLARDSKLGLLGMQERARLIKGELLVQSTPGLGTTVVVEAPI